MLRLTLYLPSANLQLGYTAVQSFHNAFGEVLEPVQTVDDDFIEKYSLMPTQDFGFTEEFRKTSLEVLEKHRNGKLLITNEAFPYHESQVTQYNFLVATYLNKGFELNEISSYAQQLLESEVPVSQFASRFESHFLTTPQP